MTRSNPTRDSRLGSLTAALLATLIPGRPVAQDAPFPDDYTWMNGQSRQRNFPLVASIDLDTQYTYWPSA
jgi:hypothetical protein